MISFAVSLLACVAAVAGLRVVSKHNAAKGVQSGTETAPRGVVDSLYIYGGPEIGKPALTSFGGCFKGRHVVTVRNYFVTKAVDLVSVVGRSKGYQGAWIDLQELDLSLGVKETECGADGTNRPWGFGRWGLHDIPEYLRLVESSGVTSDEAAFAYFALFSAGEKNSTEAKKGIERRGWRLVASANHPGGGIIGGPQVSHLIQHPQTLDCVVTFQFTMTGADWWNNLKLKSERFCELGRVHKGLAGALRLTVNSTEWQAKVRPNFQFCRRVISVGHSQGAAQAELFAACINQNAPSGSTYDSMSWTQSAPKNLPYL